MSDMKSIVICTLAFSLTLVAGCNGKKASDSIDGVVSVPGTVEIKGVPLEMQTLDATVFAMGTLEDGRLITGSQEAHEVLLSGYAISKAPVSQELWEAVMKNNPSSTVSKTLPVDMVDYESAQSFVKKISKATGLEFNETRLQDDLERLKEDLLKDEGYETFMYRDFQARNVMVKDGEPYFIDFQGGRRGPIYYDVASFIWQARSRYPENLRKEMVQTYLTALKGYTQVDETVFHERLRLFVLFRTLQVLGAYGFRGYFEKKPHFLASVPYALSNLRKLLQKPFVEYPYLNEILTTLATMPQFNNIAEDKRLEVRIFSFAYKKGIPVDTTGNGGGFVFDCRAVNNPGKYEHYRQFTGLDPEVVKFLEDDGGITKFLDNVYSLVDTHVKRFMERKFTHMQVCFGCTGGQHRSVYCAEHLAKHLSDRYDIKITVSHRELDIERIL